MSNERKNPEIGDTLWIWVCISAMCCFLLHFSSLFQEVYLNRTGFYLRMEDSRNINRPPQIDIVKFRAKAIRDLTAAQPEAAALLEQMRKDVEEIRANYKGDDSQALERVVTAVLRPLERNVREIAEELKKYQDLQEASDAGR